MQNNNIFQKTYTRDTTLIMQQLWIEAFNQAISRFKVSKNFSVIVVDYIKNGVIEVWENSKFIELIKSTLFKFCNDYPNEAIILLKEYTKELDKIEKICGKDTVYTKIIDLKRFILKIKKLVLGDLFISYIGEDERLAGKAKDIAYQLRSKDHYFLNNNRVIRESLRTIFPTLSDYVNVIKLDELDEIPLLSECKHRFKNFVYASNGYSHIGSVKEYGEKNNLIFKEEKADFEDKKIKGMIANRGRAIGHIKLVFSTRDLNKVQSGDIIVSPMTTVDMMSAIKKCSAIVTDEGGTICHAAIISRELDKPCIVATKNASNILKDHDRIEVNADEGIISILD